jgi:GrpB-like predicted nucleotidyltransferase (UPF0157 family)
MIHDSRAPGDQLSTRGQAQASARGVYPAMLIGTYTPSAVEYLPYDPESPRVAARIARPIIRSGCPLQVEHIGSTAVPGCWGKGIIDLLVVYMPGCLEEARNALDGLGFQRQKGHEPFPESRPMRVGGVSYLGRTYRTHAHVIEAGSNEARDLVRFRDLLRHNIDLRCRYEAEKRTLLARGITKGTEYSDAKGDFIRRALIVSAPDLHVPPKIGTAR